MELRPQTGLLTEVNLLDFPEGASVDEANFTITSTKERERRAGMDFEDTTRTTTGLTDTQVQTSRVSTFLWSSADLSADTSVVVVAIGNTLWFYNAGSELTAANVLNSGSSVTLTGGSGQALQFAAVAGDLYVVNGSQVVHVISYDADTDVISKTSARLKIRDLFGIDDGLDINERPSTLSNSHNYNLRNQGWQQEWNVVGVGTVYPPEGFNVGEGVYPSNADIFYLGLIFDADDNVNRFSSRELTESTGEAPKGHYIIDAFNRGASRATFAAEETTGYSGTVTFPEDYTDGGIVGVAAYAGRVWYTIQGKTVDGDDESPYLSTFLLYSQLVDSKEDATKCYSQNDPTDKDIPDLLATDGGFIRIPEMRKVHTMVPLQDSLVVFAENGVWQIQGGDGGFSATDQKTTKISSSGALSASSVVDADGAVFYFGESGVYAIQPDPTSLNLIPQNITENTIQTYYNNISSVAKKETVGYFDPDLRTVRWLYNSGETWYDGTNYKYRYNRELILDTTIPAWYQYTFTDDGAETTPSIAGYAPTEVFLSTSTDTVITTTDGTEITDSSLVDVTVRRVNNSISTTRLKYLILDDIGAGYRIGFGYYRNESFRDFPDTVNIDAAAFLVTGYATFGDSQRKKRSNYLTVHCRRTESGFEESGDEFVFLNPSSCKVQSQWDWNTSDIAGNFGTEFQAYRLPRNFIPSGATTVLDYSYSVITTKNRLRGQGRALSLKFSSEADKDLKLLGWAMDITANEET